MIFVLRKSFINYNVSFEFQAAVGFNIAYSCQYTSSSQNATCNCAMYGNMLGRFEDDQGQRTDGAVTLIPIGRIEANVEKEVEEEINTNFFSDAVDLIEDQF